MIREAENEIFFASMRQRAHSERVVTTLRMLVAGEVSDQEKLEKVKVYVGQNDTYNFGSDFSVFL